MIPKFWTEDIAQDIDQAWAAAAICKWFCWISVVLQFFLLPKGFNKTSFPVWPLNTLLWDYGQTAHKWLDDWLFSIDLDHLTIRAMPRSHSAWWMWIHGWTDQVAGLMSHQRIAALW